MTRWFTYRFGGRIQMIGKSGLSYHFTNQGGSPVDRNEDAEWFLHLGTPESGVYLLREVDAAGTPVGPFPPVDPAMRVSQIDPKKFPSDQGLPGAEEWRHATEEMSDPWLFYHISRKKLIP